jgi:hypothetical protein
LWVGEARRVAEGDGLSVSAKSTKVTVKMKPKSKRECLWRSDITRKSYNKDLAASD